MNSTTDKYNLVALIQQEIRQKKYTRAIVSLKALASVGGNRQMILWHSALLESKVGNFPIALHYLKEIDGELFPKATKLQVAIEEKFPVYEALIAGYNDAVLSMKNGQLEQSLEQLNKAIVQADTIPLPTFIYKAKLLLLAKLQKESLARFAVDIPVYASEDETILKVLSFIQNHPEIVPVKVENKSGNKKLIIPYVAALAAISVAVYVYVSDKPVKDTAIDDFAKREEVMQEKPAIQEAEDEVLEEAEDENLDETLDVEIVEEVQPVFIPEHIAKTYYLTGHSRYKNGQYEEAISYLTMALASEETAYFTDDAAYFLTVSYIEEEQYGDALQLAEQFSANENIHYKDSPYREAVRLQQGIASYHLGDIDESTKVLTDLTVDSKVDWVTYEARNMLKTVMGNE